MDKFKPEYEFTNRPDEPSVNVSVINCLEGQSFETSASILYEIGDPSPNAIKELLEASKRMDVPILTTEDSLPEENEVG